jgi:zinc/manganese transport system permease protein
MTIDSAAFEGLSWNPISDLNQLFAYHFMVNALEAGTIVAVMAGAIGWFMVIRRQTFAGHTLAVIAFPGAAGAILVGLPALVGYYAACIVGAVSLSIVSGPESRSRASESAAIGSVQALGLALGFLFVNLYNGVLNGLGSLLFGTFLGITDQQVAVLLGVGVAALIMLAFAGRPLYFASVDGVAARANGVPVDALSVGFLVLLGMAVAATSQITGALLVFALLVAPAAAAQQLTARPAQSLALTLVIALAVTWLGLGIAYFSIYPVGFFVTTLAFAVYVLTRIVRAIADREMRPASRNPVPVTDHAVASR